MMRRGDLVTVAIPGGYGKPRPALVLQSDRVRPIDSATVAPLTTEFIDDADDLRVEIMPSDENGLRHTSYVMIDKIGTIRRTKCGPRIGHLSEEDMARVNRALAVFLGFA
jgi:mRNA interferase MazF